MAKPFGELDLIRRIRESAKSAPQPKSRSLLLGIGDDCAILRPPRGHDLLVTTDFSLEGRHFRRDLHPAQSVGHRALARGLSDLAAMGASPLAAFLSLALPAELPATRAGRAWITGFLAGFQALARACSVPLAGGDTSEAPSSHVLADIILLGSAPRDRALRRSAGRPGDILYVTGRLGGSAAELAGLSSNSVRSRHRSGPADPNRSPHLYPQPRLAVGQALLRRRLATAAIDLSDGLSTDLAHLCQESSVGAEISEVSLPIHPLAAFGEDPVSQALNGGEDYELLFAARPSTKIPHTIAGVAITRIGTLTGGQKIHITDARGRRRPLRPAGWEHFSR
ncbi:MAG TPA: thiamine-phosphate kinase [Acidobacteriaceae bacterium]|nr:thiamine-phosphate kinase [Acidobacteriaceae bacterium]